MSAHGWFHKVHRKRPLILATLYNKHLARSVTLSFIIDTGAERSLIVPYYEEILDLPQDKLVDYPNPIDTIGGKMYFTALPHCSLIFNDNNHNPYPVHDVAVHFFCSKRNKSKKALVGKPAYPNILGRDVLEHVSLGYCQKSEYLFVTKNTTTYFNKLKSSFPKPKFARNWLH